MRRLLAQATNLQTYELQLLFVIRPISHVKVLSRADVNAGFLETILPFGEVTLHSSANVQRHDVGVWSDENPHEKTERALSINCSTFVVC
jgi:hypothetical protein